jgi:peptidoglycan hydrolase-like protein with peptidoglycan-binding domain
VIRSSKAAVDLIISHEIGSRAQYEKLFKRPCWPGGQSGVTVAIGYDLGYQTREKVAKDFGLYLSAAMIIAMQNVVGLKGTQAKAALSQVKNRVEIPWDIAVRVFKEVDLPRYEAMLIRACPGVEELPADCFGALASITYNRGPGGFTSGGERFSEMRVIRADIASHNWEDIPRQIRKMKRIWANANLPGLLRRRDDEAKLFERGLQGGSEPAEDAPLPPWLTERENKPVTPEGSINIQPDRAGYNAVLETAQRELVAMNYHEVGDIDGKFGGRTRAAITAFMTDRGENPHNGEFTEAVLSEISQARAEQWSRPIKPERGNATAKDIENKVPIVKQTFWQKVWAYILGVPAAITGVFKGIFGDQGDGIGGYVQPVKDFLSGVPTEVYLLAVVGIAIAIFVQAKRVQDKTVAAYQRGEIN